MCKVAGLCLGLSWAGSGAVISIPIISQLVLDTAAIPCSSNPLLSGFFAPVKPFL